MHLAELTYETEEGRKKHRKSMSTCRFCIRFTLVALLIILLAATTTATIFFLLARGEIGECSDSVTTTQSPISTTTTTTTTTTQPPPPLTTTTITTQPSLVLTAGPCCDEAKSFTIFLSGIDKPSRQIGKSTIYVKDNRIDLSNLDYGVCTIHLDAPVSAKGITTIRLPSRSQRSDTFEKFNATVSGWGRTSIDDNSLIYTDVIIKEKTFCQQVYPEVGAERTLCTYDTNGLGICDGLVGDPLTITDSDGVETQVGYASFGPSRKEGGCKTYYPNGYVRVTAYLDLIEIFGDVDIRP
ncbi:Hypothetical predicted protein [Cloeon dipterum]|uniref:Peptidase S1 domain-containing protein n=1 Tax=Cloeon dipterum TaxID=197152 RepID=A0A8S1DXI2_9INSE|nr:Hypothetical predicted protein [Cloeon dipterum]